MAVYILLGGALFVSLEARHERIVQTDVATTRDDYVRRLCIARYEGRNVVRLQSNG